MPCNYCTSLALFATVLALIYLFMTWSYGSWKKKGIKEAKSYPIVGSFPSILAMKKHFADDIHAVYRQFRSTENFVGVHIARKPCLLILNPELAHKVFVNDFKYFHDNELSNLTDEKKDLIFASNPFCIKGEAWKEHRNQIAPGLTINRVKNAYPVTLEVCDKFKSYIDEQMKIPGTDGIDTIDLALRFTCEVTSDCVLGVKANCFDGEPTQILETTKRAFDVNYKVMLYQLIIGLIPGIESWFKIRIIPKPDEIFYTGLMQKAIEIRRKQKNDRVDFLNYLLQLQKKKNLSVSEMTAHSMTFLLDGFSTTAVAISHCLLHLARYPQVQEKLRKEILDNLEANGSLDFEKLHDLPYLDACFHESLRLFSPVLFSKKLCTASYEFENSNGLKVYLKPGDVVIVPLNSIHLDEKYYENPTEYIPERFMGEESLKSYREKGLFYGFGDGPRSCLGMRFALTQSKAAIVEVIKSYQITVNPKTRSDSRLDPKQFVGMLDGGVYLNYESRK